MNRRFAAAICVSLCVAQAAHAQSLAEVSCPDTSKSGPADMHSLRSAALSGVSLDALDANNDGAVSADEIFSALTDSSFCQKGHRNHECSDDDKLQLARGQGNLSEFWANHPSIQMVALRSITADDIRALPGLALEPWAPVLDERQRFVDVRCVATTAAIAAGTAGTDKRSAETPPSSASGQILTLGTLFDR